MAVTKISKCTVYGIKMYCDEIHNRRMVAYDPTRTGPEEVSTIVEQILGCLLAKLPLPCCLARRVVYSSFHLVAGANLGSRDLRDLCGPLPGSFSLMRHSPRTESYDATSTVDLAGVAEAVSCLGLHVS